MLLYPVPPAMQGNIVRIHIWFYFSPKWGISFLESFTRKSVCQLMTSRPSVMGVSLPRLSAITATIYIVLYKKVFSIRSCVKKVTDRKTFAVDDSYAQHIFAPHKRDVALSIPHQDNARKNDMRWQNQIGKTKYFISLIRVYFSPSSTYYENNAFPSSTDFRVFIQVLLTPSFPLYEILNPESPKIRV